ncbi:MAG: hypothetical protein R6V03_11110 [Kiritimatiellia bacterium]
MNTCLSAMGASAETVKCTELAREKMSELELSAAKYGELGVTASGGIFEKKEPLFYWQVETEEIGSVERGIDEKEGITERKLNLVKVTVWKEGSDRSVALCTYLGTKEKK